MTPSPHWPAYSAAFFISAIGFLFVGVGLGLYMAATHDYTLRPVHVHVNLLGWVSSAIMGLFHAHVGAVLNRRFIWIQYGLYTAGVVVGMAGLAAMLLEFEPLLLLVPIGTGATLVAVVMFGWMIIRAARRSEAFLR